MTETETKHALMDGTKAIAHASAGFAPLPARMVPLAESLGCVLAEHIVADRDLPPFDRSMLDGFAVQAGEAKPGMKWEVVGEMRAGDGGIRPVTPGMAQLGKGTCIAISTGAAVPAPFDAVVPHEWTNLSGTVSGQSSESTSGIPSGEPMTLVVDRTIKPGDGIHPRASDAGAGRTVIDTGRIMSAHHIGIAASVGAAQVEVIARPRCVVLTSGDEVRLVSDPVEPHQIRNSNGPMLQALLGCFGAEVLPFRHVTDDRNQTEEQVAQSLAQTDILVTVGGVSVGRHDHFPAVFDKLGVKWLVRGAAIQPGKPIRVGRVNNTAVVALPGNPVSALVCAHLFIEPIVSTMSGRGGQLAWRDVTLAEAVKPNARRRAYRPARILRDDLVAVPTWSGSGDLAHTAKTDGFVELPISDKPVAAGTTLRFLPWACATVER